jgi:serine/threonine protein kinase
MEAEKVTGPKRIGKYEALEEVGRGRFAVVYKARDTGWDRVVALKVLLPPWAEDPDLVTRFCREARAAARLRHPHIVTIYEAGQAESQPYIAMEYLPGRTLQALLEAEGALPLERALPILEQVSSALDYAYKQNAVHLDIKPTNVMVEETGQNVQATLMDFGLAKAMAGSATLASQGALLGSPQYMAPEQAKPKRGVKIGPRADRYALGVVAYQMLTGQVPFPGDTPATLNAHARRPVPSPRSLCPDLPEAVEAVLVKMLAKSPADRFASARGFVAQLRVAVLTESQRREQETQLAPLYEQLEAAATQEDWVEVLALGEQIQAISPDHRDVVQWMAWGNKRLRRLQGEPLPGRAWVPGALVALAIITLSVAAVFLGPHLHRMVAGEHRPTPVAAVHPTLTATPSPSATSVPATPLAPSPTPRPSPTEAAAVAESPAAAATPVPTPTPTATPSTPTATPTPTAISSTPTATPTPTSTPTGETPTPSPVAPSVPWAQLSPLEYCFEGACTRIGSGFSVSKVKGGEIVWQITGVAADIDLPGNYYLGTDVGVRMDSGEQTAYIQAVPGHIGCWDGPGEPWRPLDPRCGAAYCCASGKAYRFTINVAHLPDWVAGATQITPALRTWRRGNVKGDWGIRIGEHWETGKTLVINVEL